MYYSSRQVSSRIIPATASPSLSTVLHRWLNEGMGLRETRRPLRLVASGTCQGEELLMGGEQLPSRLRPIKAVLYWPQAGQPAPEMQGGKPGFVLLLI